MIRKRRIELLADLPIDWKHGMRKGRIFDVICSQDKPGEFTWEVRSDSGVLVWVMRHEARELAGDNDTQWEGKGGVGVIIAKGSIFIVTAGAYSSYTILGTYRAIEDIDTAKLAAEYQEEYPSQSLDSQSLKVYRFAEWLAIDKQVARETDELKAWHLADYCDWSE